MQRNADISHRELEFATFVIENVAAQCGVSGDVIYRSLAENSDILQTYIIPCYDVLHTQGKDYIVNDIVELMERERVLL